MLTSQILRALYIKQKAETEYPISSSTKMILSPKNSVTPRRYKTFSERLEAETTSLSQPAKLRQATKYWQYRNLLDTFLEGVALLEQPVDFYAPVSHTRKQESSELKAEKGLAGILLISNRSQIYRGEIGDENIDKIIDRARASQFKKVFISDPCPHRSLLNEKVATAALHLAITLTNLPIAENRADMKEFLKSLPFEIEKRQQECLKEAKDKAKYNAKKMWARFQKRLSEEKPEKKSKNKLEKAPPLTEKELLDARNKYLLVTQFDKPHLWKKLQKQAKKEAKKRALILLNFLKDKLTKLKGNYGSFLVELFTKHSAVIKMNLAKSLIPSILSHYVEDHSWMIAMSEKLAKEGYDPRLLYPIEIARTEALAEVISEFVSILDTSPWIAKMSPEETTVKQALQSGFTMLPPAAPKPPTPAAISTSLDHVETSSEEAEISPRFGA